MVTFILTNLKRETSSIVLLVSLRGKKYKRTTGESTKVTLWNNKKKRVKVTAANLLGNDINEVLDRWESSALQAIANFKTSYDPPTSEEFFKVLNSIYFPDIDTSKSVEVKIKPLDFFGILDRYLETQKFSDVRMRGYGVLIRALRRYELFRRKKLNINTINSDDIRGFETFLRDEHTFFTQAEGEKPMCKQKYIHVYQSSLSVSPPRERGRNTIVSEMNKFKAFILWSINIGEYTTNNPFAKFKIQQEIYGTPYYITIEERNQIYEFDFSKSKSLEIQRDIFVFQCLLGCRVSDLYKLTKHNIIENIVEYVPSKTKEGDSRTIRVPLNKTGLDIIAKYSNIPKKEEALLPFISSQKYNTSIKKIFTQVGITRSVTILSPLTGVSVQKAINEVASSHLARRTFVGNLYKKVKDPSLVGALSGHKEGSKSFARYREIDDDIKRDLIDLIE